MQQRICFGLRPQHYESWRAQSDLPELFEVVVDNHLFQRGGPALGHLEWFAARAQISFHGVGLNIGGEDVLSKSYLSELRRLVDLFNPVLVSDHLCFTQSGGHFSYDLLPFPLNGPSLRRVCERVSQVQDALGRTIALENVSRYINFRSSTMSELAFLDEVCEQSGCGVLLDVNNLYVNAHNFGEDPTLELLALGPQRVFQYHIAGHSVVDDFLHDTHDHPIKDDVWDLLDRAMVRFGSQPVILEHDDDSAPLEVLLDMADRWKQLRVSGGQARSPSDDAEFGQNAV
jgi:uncharacterized protein (UPF0276 family)